MISVIKRLAAVFAFAFYLVSLFLAAYKTASGAGNMIGFSCLVAGTMSIFYNFFAFLAWLANFGFFVSLITNLLNRAYKTSVTLSGISFLFSFFALLVSKIMINEGGTEEAVTIGPAVILWIFSMFAMLIASVIPTHRNKSAAV